MKYLVVVEQLQLNSREERNIELKP